MTDTKNIGREILRCRLEVETFCEDLKTLQNELHNHDDYSWKQRALVSRQILTIKTRLTKLNKTIYGK